MPPDPHAVVGVQFLGPGCWLWGVTGWGHNDRPVYVDGIATTREAAVESGRGRARALGLSLLEDQEVHA